MIGRHAMLAVALALVASGCSYALHPRYTVKGHAFAVENLRQVTAGAREAEVVALLGDPLEVSEPEPGRSVWRYYEQARLRGCRITMLGVIPRGDAPVVETEAHIWFRAGVVERVQGPKEQPNAARGGITTR